MPVPQAVVEALNTLQGTKDTYDVLVTDAATKAAAATKAVADSQAAESAKSTGAQQLVSDVKTLEAAIDQAYSASPAPAPPVVAA